jgi:hypothetical protein
MTKKTRKPTKPAKPARPAKRARAAKQVAPAKKSNPAKPPGKGYVLLGADEYAKPRAARFSAEEMYLRLVEVTDPDVAEIASQLPAGRLHANGKELVPYIKGPCITNCSSPHWPTRRRNQIRTRRPKTCRAPGTRSYPDIS